MRSDFFKHKAKSYEQAKYRVTNVSNIADSIRDRIALLPSMEIMDFGSGTGLLLKNIAPSVRKISAVDISSAMNQQLQEKSDDLDCELEIIEIDLSRKRLDRKFDGIISSMTMHHVQDIEAMFRRFDAMLNDGGFLAIADLDSEDGSFHEEDTGVFHNGFDREQFVNFSVNAGFQHVEIQSASIVTKPQGDYPVFLLTAIKQ